MPALTGVDIPQPSTPSCWPRFSAWYSFPPALQRLLGLDRITTPEMYLNFSPEKVIREVQQKR